MNKEINIGYEYDTLICHKIVSVVVNKIIENSYPNQISVWDNACSVTIVNTKHNLMRRISELHESL